MTDTEYREKILICDDCGKVVKGFEDLQAVIDYKKSEGWESRRVKDKCNNWNWEDYCPKCK